MARKAEYKIPENDVDPQDESKRRYRKTAKGKASIKRDGKSSSHTRAQLKYARSSKGKEAFARWHNSPKGKAYAKKQSEDRARALLMLEREEQGLCALCESPDHAMDFHLNGTQK